MGREREVEVDPEDQEAHPSPLFPDHDIDDVEDSVVMDASTKADEGVVWAPVVGGERCDERLAFTVLVDGQERTVEVPWPDDPTDEDEEVVRLARCGGTTVDRIADIDRVPVVRTEEDVFAAAPPVSSCSRKRVDLPAGTTVNVPWPSVTGSVKALASRALLWLAVSPLAGYTEYEGEVVLPTFDKRFILGSGGLIGLLLAVAVVATGGPLLAVLTMLLLGSLLGTVGVLGVLAVLIVAEDIRVVDRC